MGPLVTPAMKRALVISSQVAASAVGASNSAFCLRRLGIETAVLPTTLMGRHPGWGDPGGDVTKSEYLAKMWDGIKAQNLTFDAVLTGYMGSADNVDLAANIIAKVKSDNPSALTVVDPVMGDHGKLYVPINVAEAIVKQLVSVADIVTPNVWEFSHILQRELRSLDDLKNALLDHGGCALVTSVEHHGRIGALSYHPKGLTYFGHEVFETVPNGGGDALSGALLAHILGGLSEEEAARKAVSAIFKMMKKSVETKAKEFPLTEYQAFLTEAPLIGMDRIL